MSHPTVLHNRNISIATIHSVGDSLQSAVRQGNVIFAVGQVSIPALLGSEVIVGVVILDCVLPGVDGRAVSVAGLRVRGSGIGGGWLVDNHGLVGHRGRGRSNIIMRYKDSIYQI